MKKHKVYKQLFIDCVKGAANPSTAKLIITTDQLYPASSKVPTAYFYKNKLDMYLHVSNIVFIGTQRFLFDDGTIRDCIMTDSFFDGLPSVVKEFLINHELGHIINGDTSAENIKRINDANGKRVFGITNSFELKADEFAASVIGKDKCMKSLRYMMRNTDLGLASKIEIYSRYRALKNA